MNDICGTYAPCPPPHDHHTGHPESSSVHGGTAFTGGAPIGLVVAIVVMLVLGIFALRAARHRP